MNCRLKIGLTAATLALLVACSSGIQEFDAAEPTLEPQATGSFWDRIGTSADDAEQLPSGYLTLTGPDLDIGEKPNGDNIITGLRFPGATIPQGATIDTVQLTFRPVTSNSTTASVTVRAQDADTAAPFSTTFQDLSSRTKTSASATWSAPAWTAGTDSTFTNSAALNAVVQEVVNRPGWKSGSALAFFISGTGVRTAYSYDELAGKAPVLYVAYSTGPVGADPDLAAKVDPNFSVDDIQDTNVRADYTNFINKVKAEKNAFQCGSTSTVTVSNLACRGDVYQYRIVNDQITALAAVFRLTGDKVILDEIDRLMQLARSKLKDQCLNVTKCGNDSTDGYVNWLYLNQSTDSAEYYNSDWHEMEESLTHGMVAMVAYIFQENSQYATTDGSTYGARATFWKDYLKNDFEAKWDSRFANGLRQFLFHSYVTYIRYYYYMSKLFPNDPKDYLGKANTAKNVIFAHLNNDNGAYVWSHDIDLPTPAAGERDDFPHKPYVDTTMYSTLDLAIGGYSSFATKSFTTMMSKSVWYHMLNSSPTSTTPIAPGIGDTRSSWSTCTKSDGTKIQCITIDGQLYERNTESRGSDSLMNRSVYSFYTAFASPTTTAGIRSHEIYQTAVNSWNTGGNHWSFSSYAGRAFSGLWIEDGFTLP